MRKLILFIISLLTWIFLDWPLLPLNFLIGVAASIFVVYVVGDLCLKTPGVWSQPQRYFYYIFLYLPTVVWEMTKANIDAAIHILHPDPAFKPGIVKVKTILKNEIALTALANSISYMPGMIVVDIDPENGFLYVHWNDVKHQEMTSATKVIVEKFEKILLKIFY
ncbi:MAG: Na+/H+ antiporter subunit E [Candidatus Omnitrophica bacterium]|nr:Na+/H+ antiporter subunit E [Candidatus Omnitrophota bacterium]